MSRTLYKHNHQYKAVTPERKSYRCTVGDCPHVITASLLPGRKSECPACGNVLTITADNLKRITIACIGCGEVPWAKNSKQNKNRTEEPIKPGSMKDLFKTARGLRPD